MVTATPFSASSDASVAPDGPLPIIPTVLVVLLMRNAGCFGFALSGISAMWSANASDYPATRVEV